MSFNKIKVGGLSRIFICAGLGLLLLGTGCALKTNEEAQPKAVKVPADEMITIPWNEGWSPAISIIPGIPVELQGSEEVTYEISGDINYLCVDTGGKLKSMSEGETTKKAGERFYWNYLFGDSQEQPAGIGTSWISVVRKQEGNPTGWVLIKISSSAGKIAVEDGGLLFKADIIASLNFPRQDGNYQAISDEDLKNLEASYKN